MDPNDVERLITVPWRTIAPGWKVEFLDSRHNLCAETFPHERRISIYVNVNQTLEEIAFVLAHEIGHVVDHILPIHDEQGYSRRRAWQKMRHITDLTTWWGRPDEPDFGVGSGDFAECFAVWVIGTGVKNQLQYGPLTEENIEFFENLTGWRVANRPEG